MKKINICFFIGSFQAGGAEKHVLQILKNINKDIYNPFLCVLSVEGLLKTDFDILKIPIFIVKDYNSKFKNKLLWPYKIRSLVHFLKSNRIDVIHIHLVGCYIISILSSYLAKIPNKIITWHNIYDNSVRRWNSIDDIFKNFKLFYRVFITSLLTNNIIAVSNNVKIKNCKFFKINPNKVYTVYNGINPNKIHLKNAYKNNYDKYVQFHIGAIGTLQKQKDYLTMLKAFKKILPEYPNVHLSIMGDGPERNVLTNYIKQNGLNDNVELTGVLKNIPEILPTLDLFLMTSLWEGFSIAILEAMAAGLPILATSVGGNPEAIVHNESGILVTPENIEEIAIALEKIILNPELAKKYGLNAKKRFNALYTVDEMMNKLNDIYLMESSKKQLNPTPCR